MKFNLLSKLKNQTVNHTGEKAYVLHRKWNCIPPWLPGA